MPYGDTQLLIQYTGDDLGLRTVRLGFDTSCGSLETCRRLVQSWLVSGEEDRLRCVVEVEMTLVAGALGLSTPVGVHSSCASRRYGWCGVGR